MAHDPYRRLAPRTAEDLRSVEDRPPRWWPEARRAAGYGAGAFAFFSGVFLLSLTGWLRYSPASSDTIEADVGWVAILAVGCGFMWPFLLLSTERDDHGYPRRNLTSILLPALLVVSAIGTAAVTGWSLLMDGRAPTDSVLMTITSDPISLLTVVAALVATHAWCTTCVLGFVRPGCLRLGLGLPTWFVVAGLCFWRAVVSFEEPPSAARALVWAVVAGLGLAALALLALVDETWGEPSTRAWR